MAEALSGGCNVQVTHATLHVCMHVLFATACSQSHDQVPILQLARAIAWAK